jgi:hypothetical protein
MELSILFYNIIPFIKIYLIRKKYIILLFLNFKILCADTDLKVTNSPMLALNAK